MADGVETAIAYGADLAPFPGRWLQRSLPPPLRDRPARDAWIRVNIAETRLEA
jgi:hypothetical protein